MSDAPRTEVERLQWEVAELRGGIAHAAALICEERIHEHSGFRPCSFCRAMVASPYSEENLKMRWAETGDAPTSTSVPVSGGGVAALLSRPGASSGEVERLAAHLVELAERAQREVGRICEERWNGKEGWRTTIPVDLERDSDAIIGEALRATRELAELVARGVRGAAPSEPSERAIDAAAQVRWHRGDGSTQPWGLAPEFVRKAYRETAAHELRAAYAVDGGGSREEARP